MLNVAQFIIADHDIVDREFRSAFPDVNFRKCDSPSELAQVMPEVDVLFINNQNFTRDIGRIVATAPRLKWIQFSTVGIDTARKNGLPTNLLLSNVRGLRTGILAGHAIALMLGVMRGFNSYQKFRDKREWGRMEMFPTILAPDDATLVILGLGEIGREIARKAKAFDMYVIGVSRESAPGGDIDEVVPRERLAEVLPRADVLMIAMPLDRSTEHFIGAPQLALLKPTAVVVNVSRGGVVDEAALIDVLQANRIAGLGTDVTEVEPLPPDSPIWDMGNVLLTPHLAGCGGDAQRLGLSRIFATNLTRFRRGERLYNEIAHDGSILPGNVPLSQEPVFRLKTEE